MSDLLLPPLLNPIEVSDPFETAVTSVRQRRSGAGDFFWAPSQSQADFAIVLEPEVNSSRTGEMVPLALVAASECLAVLLPPQVAVQFRDQQVITVNGGVAGSITTAMAEQTAESDPPDWLVLSLNVNLRWPDDAGDPGLRPDVTALAEEGWEEPNLEKFLETFARHFLTWISVWQEEGFEPVARAWKFKAENETEPDMTDILQNIKRLESTMAR